MDDILDKFRKPNGSKPRNGKVNPSRRLKTFTDVVSDKWKELGLEGEPNTRLLELMLIELIETLYRSYVGAGAENFKMAAMQRDAMLLSFGLLKGYPHTTIMIDKEVNTWLEDRYEDYLNDSDFIKIQYPDKGTYQEIKKKWKASGSKKQNLPLGRLTHLVSDNKKELVKELSTIIKSRAYKQYLDKDGNVPEFELPEPYFTLENFPILTEQESEPTQALPGENPDGGNRDRLEGDKGLGKMGEEPPKISPQDPPTTIDDPPYIPPKSSKTAVWLKVSVATFVVLFFILVVIGIGNIVIAKKAISQAMEESNVNQKPYSIKFRNPDEWLPFGKNYYLTVEPKPSDSTLEGLRCESKNPDIIEILSEAELHIKATEEAEDRQECKVRIKAYMSYDKNIKDEMTVHVIKDGQNESTGEGELDDKTPGDSSQRVN